MVEARPPLQTDMTVDLNHGRYILRPNTLEIFAQDWEHDDRKLPITLFSPMSGELTSDYITRCVQHFESEDDVFSSDFKSGIIVVQSAQTLHWGTTDSEPVSHLQCACLRVIKTIIGLPLFADGSALPDGPYFLHKGYIYEAWKLYPDELSSFQTTVLPSAEDPYKFDVLDAVSSDGFWRAVAVPSRMYSGKPTKVRPLAGARIAVKDLFHLSGIKSALNVRAFLEMYGPDTSTAEYVKKLIDLGAIIVGKTKMTAFAGGERAPEFWIDFHCPFNPRADGYQTPSGSTSGGGACLAGYEFLDYSLGSDTYGSIRWPAAANGLYGLRCTVDIAAPMEGIYAQVPSFDTLGLLGRDLSSLYHMAKVSLNSTISDDIKFPSKILCPTDWSGNHSSFHNAVVNKLASALANFLGISETYISIADTWRKNSPSHAESKTFQDFFHKTGYNIFYFDAYHEWDAFRADYRSAFGKKPYVGPHVTYLWGLGARITTEERTEAISELETFRSWINDKIFSTSTHPNSDPGAVMILPVLNTEPDYRDVLSGPFQARFGVDEVSFGSWLGVPELVLPLDQIAYHSKITDREELLPVSVSILGPKGSDLMLISLAIAALNKAHWPTSLQTGRYIFKDAGLERARKSSL